MSVLVYCSTDEAGNILEGIVGERVMPDKQYDYFFYLDTKQEIDLTEYHIKDDVLTERGR